MIEERQNIKGIVNVATIEITPATQEKSVTPSKEIQEVKPDRGYVGLSKVIVDKVTSEVDSNILPSNIKEGVSILGVDGNVVELKGETKEVTPTKNEQTILPSEGKNALTSVIVNAVDSTIDRNILSNNIRQGVEILGVQGWLVPLKGEERTITPSTSQQTITPSDGKNAITSAIVNAVTKDIDSNIKAENIKKDTEILGVIGTLEGQKEEQTKTIEPNFSNGNVIVTPDENKVLNSVTITKDNDLTPSNIKSGVEVFGVTGTFDKTLGAKTITSNGTYKASDDNLDGYSQVEVETSGVDINEYYDLTKKRTFGNITYYIKTIPLIDTSSYTNMESLFRYYETLESIPLLDTRNVTTMMNMCANCKNLKSFPQFDTSKVTNFYSMFSWCLSLKELPRLDFSSAQAIRNITYGAYRYIKLGGFKDLGKSYETSASANNSDYTLDISQGSIIASPNSLFSTDIDHDSLMNVINNLYDIATKGVKTQQLTIGNTNLAKLTAEEIAIATNKGWTVS